MTGDIMYWQWILLGLVLIGLEFVISTFVSLWFGVGALLVGLMSYFFDMTTIMQLCYWIFFSVAGLSGWFIFFKKHKEKRSLKELQSQIQGQNAVVTLVDESQTAGRCRFYTPFDDREEWQFESKRSLSFGDTIVVIHLIDQQTVFVKKVGE